MARHEAPRPRGARARLRALRFGFATIWTNVWGVLAVTIITVAVPDWMTGGEDAVGSFTAALICSVMTVLGLVMLRDRRRAGKPVYRRPDTASIPPPRVRPERRYRLPSPGSVARQPMRQLAESESALAQLVDRLRDMEVPAGVVDEAWRTATDTAARLRAVGSALESVELAAKHAPPGERAALEDGVGSLRIHLTQGLDGYRGLIAAAGRVLLAGAPDLRTDELVEVTEGLAAMADALDELAERELPR
jgi:hypothetical protein